MAEGRALAHDSGVCRQVGAARYTTRQLCEIGETTHRRQLAQTVECFSYGDDVDRLVVFQQLRHHPKNLAVRRLIEIVAPDNFGNPIKPGGVEHQTAEDGLLRLYGMR